MKSKEEEEEEEIWVWLSVELHSEAQAILFCPKQVWNVSTFNSLLKNG